MTQPRIRSAALRLRPAREHSFGHVAQVFASHASPSARFSTVSPKWSFATLVGPDKAVNRRAISSAQRRGFIRFKTLASIHVLVSIATPPIRFFDPRMAIGRSERRFVQPSVTMRPTQNEGVNELSPRASTDRVATLRRRVARDEGTFSTDHGEQGNSRARNVRREPEANDRYCGQGGLP